MESVKRRKTYIEQVGISSVVSEYFRWLLSLRKLPSYPFPPLAQRLRVAGLQKATFLSLDDDIAKLKKLYCFVEPGPAVVKAKDKEGRAVWGLHHMLQFAHPRLLNLLGGLLGTMEQELAAHSLAGSGDGYEIEVRQAILNQAAMLGKLCPRLSSPVEVLVEVEVQAPQFEQAVESFSRLIMADLHTAVDSPHVMCLGITITTKKKGRQQGAEYVRHWEVDELCDNSGHAAAEFASAVKASLPSYSAVTLDLVMGTDPTSGTAAACQAGLGGGRLLHVHRSYALFYRWQGNVRGFSRHLLHAPAVGVFLSEQDAKRSFAATEAQDRNAVNEGMVSVRQELLSKALAARELGDDFDALVLIAQAMLIASRSNSRDVLAFKDLTRVTSGPAHVWASFASQCASIAALLRRFAVWVQHSEGASVKDDNGHAIEAWARHLHQAFWLWRRDLFDGHLESGTIPDIMCGKDYLIRCLSEITDIPGEGMCLDIEWDKEHLIRTASFATQAAVVCEHLDNAGAWLSGVAVSITADTMVLCANVDDIRKEQKRRKEQQLLGGSTQKRTKQSAAAEQQANLSLQEVLDAQWSWLAHGDEEESEETKKRKKKLFGGGRRSSKVEPSPMPKVDPQLQGDFIGSTDADLGVESEVLVTLQQDYVPPCIAAEGTLMQYITDHRLDQALETSLTKVLQGVLLSNPFPIMTNAICQMALKEMLWQENDHELLIDFEPHVKHAQLRQRDGRLSQIWASPVGPKEAVFGCQTAVNVADPGRAFDLLHLLPHPLPAEQFGKDSTITVEAGLALVGGTLVESRYALHQELPTEIEAAVMYCAEYAVAEQAPTVQEMYYDYVASSVQELHEGTSHLVVSLAVGPESKQWGRGERADVAELVRHKMLMLADGIYIPSYLTYVLVGVGPGGKGAQHLLQEEQLWFEAVHEVGRVAKTVEVSLMAHYRSQDDLKAAYLSSLKKRVRALLEREEFLKAYKAMVWLRSCQEDGAKGQPAVPAVIRALSSAVQSLDHVQGMLQVLEMLLGGTARAIPEEVRVEALHSAVWEQSHRAIAALAKVFRDDHPVRFEGLAKSCKRKAAVVAQKMEERKQPQQELDDGKDYEDFDGAGDTRANDHALAGLLKRLALEVSVIKVATEVDLLSLLPKAQDLLR